jgi:UDP-N-acetylglucosamine transferase subunit ALG13
MIGRYDVEAVISTGSAVAVPFLTAAALRRRPAFYIESATRADGPSQTFKILRSVPGVEMRTQSPEWASARHPYVGSVFDGWSAVTGEAPQIRRVVVSLGTMKRYSFRALVDRVIKILPPNVDVLWQVGVTDVSDLPIDARASVPADELQQAIQSADAIIAHAGTGIALTAMESGRCPVLVPRRASRNEHVDDHQLQTARRLADAGLAVAAEVDDLSWDDVKLAAGRRVVDRPDSAPIDLGRSR